MTATASQTPTRPAAPERSGAIGGLLMLATLVVMAVGGASQAIVGLDYWTALEDGTLAEALTAAADNRLGFQLSHMLWLVGMLGIVVSGTLLRRQLRAVADHPLVDVGFHTLVMGATFNVVAYMAMASVTTTYAGATDLAGAEALLRLGLRLDDYATLLILGISPLCWALSGRGGWASNRLVGIGALALVANMGLVATAFVGGAAFVLTPAILIGVIALGAVGLRVRSLAAGA